MIFTISFVIWFFWGLFIAYKLCSELCEKPTPTNYIDELGKKGKEKKEYLKECQTTLRKAEDDVCENIRQDTSSFLKFIFTYSSAALGIFLTLILSLLKGEISKATAVLKTLIPYVVGALSLFVISIMFTVLCFLISKEANYKANDISIRKFVYHDKEADKTKNGWNIACSLIEITLFALVAEGTSIMVFIFIKIIEGVVI